MRAQYVTFTHAAYLDDKILKASLSGSFPTVPFATELGCLISQQLNLFNELRMNGDMTGLNAP